MRRMLDKRNRCRMRQHSLLSETSIILVDHSFLKLLVYPVVLSSIQENYFPANPPNSITIPRGGGNVGNSDFLHPLLGSIITCNENEMFTKFMKLTPSTINGFDSNDAYEFILD